MKKLISLILVLACLFSFAACGSSGGDESPKHVILEITDSEGMVDVHEYDTRAKTLRALLEEENLVEGEEGQFGLYVKVVDGIRADYDADGAYWAFYKGGEYLSSSVDDEILEDGASYQIVYTKG